VNRLEPQSAHTSASDSHFVSSRRPQLVVPTQLLEVRREGQVSAVALSPDGTRLATDGSYPDLTARIWIVAGP
jgi:WD40 repeat protein